MAGPNQLVGRRKRLAVPLTNVKPHHPSGTRGVVTRPPACRPPAHSRPLASAMEGDGAVDQVADAMRTTLTVGSVAGPPLADGEYVRACFRSRLRAQIRPAPR